MRKNGDGSQQSTASDGVVSRSARSSFRALSNCLRVISSGASTAARSAVSTASSAVSRNIESLHDQVLWAGFDKLEKEDGDFRRVLLLAFQSGFQIWDVEETENVHVIVSSHDGQASFMQMLPNPINSEASDKFCESRPLLAVCGGSSWEENLNQKRSSDNPGSETIVPTNVHIYSLKSRSYVHMLKFRSVIYTVRCSSRIIAVLQSSQIHCFDANTLEKRHMIVNSFIAYGSSGFGYGPLAVGPRWIAFSGSPIGNSSPKLFPPSRRFASGISTLGDEDYSVPDANNIGMVIIKDIVNKRLIAQFKAHKSPISALCFDPSGILLVTASVQGHNINVFRIMPRISTSRDTTTTPTFVHFFRLQRGFTNAVIQDISFSNDSNFIVISTSRGTSHLFEINPEGEGNSNSPVHLSAISRIRSGNSNGWIGTMSAAATATGMFGDSLPGAITSTFCYSDEPNKRNLLVFASSGCMTQYGLKENPAGSGHETGFDFESGLETEGKVAVEPIRRWSMIENQTRRETQDHHSDIYGGRTTMESRSKVFPEIVREQNVEESWKVTKEKARVEDKHQMYICEAELQTNRWSGIPLWEKQAIRFQEMKIDEGGSDGGGGEMEIEGIETRNIEVRRRDLVPVYGYLHTQDSQQVIKKSLESPRKTIEGDEVASLEGYGTETGLGDVESKEDSLESSEEDSLRREEEEEEYENKTVNNEKGKAEEKIHSEDEDEDEDVNRSNE